MITFSCATLFHTVDIRFTEYFDYFSAMAAALYGLWAAIIRTFEIKKSSTMWMAATPLLGFYCFHLMRMIGIHFGYGYNMRATIAVVVLQSTLCITWSLFVYKRAPYVKWMIAGYVWLLMSAPLEMLDFPPLLGMFDSHAIWHLSLNVVFFLWNRFYIKDTLYYRSSIQPKDD